jgi:hypothetical protein
MLFVKSTSTIFEMASSMSLPALALRERFYFKTVVKFKEHHGKEARGFGIMMASEEYYEFIRFGHRDALCQLILSGTNPK